MLVRQIRGTKDNVRTKASELIKIFNNPPYPLTLSIHLLLRRYNFFCRTKASELIKIFSKPPCPQTISMASFAKKFVLLYQEVVILRADRRATVGLIVCGKNCEKIHYMALNIYYCGAGTTADTKAVTDLVSSQLHLHLYYTGRESRVAAALALLKSHLFIYQGYVQAALVLDGVDVTGPKFAYDLSSWIYGHSAICKYGFWPLAVMAVFESKYCEGSNCKFLCISLRLW